MDTTAADPLVGALLEGRYRVGRRIARGGMATVYEATDTRLDRVVAVKVMHAGYAHDEHVVARFVREARSAARLSHPHVVGVFDQGEDDGTLFLAMEYVPGCTLRDVISDQGALPPSRAVALFEPILCALAAAHAAGIVHRDVKPENVLLTDDGRVKVADFGLARATASSTATSGVLIGTVSYLPPELVTQGSADARSDVYSAGVLLYEMLTGRKPHQGETPIQIAYKHVHEDVPAPSHAVEGIPAYLDALVARSTARQRDSRPADAKVFLHQLRRVRHALDHGVLDDAELTEDLGLVTRDGRASEPTRVVPSGLYGGLHGDAPYDDTGPDDHDGHPTAVSLPRRAEQAEHDGRGGHDVLDRRRVRKRLWGWVALAIVLLLAAGAGVGGWYLSVGRYIETPDLTGRTLVQAQRDLRPTEIDLRSGPRTYSETVPRGDIVSTEPEPGSRLLRDGTITVVVSRGKERYRMPGVLGTSEQDARNALGANLAVGNVTYRFSETVDEGLVVSASEQKGTRLRPEAEVDLVVSKGREPIDVGSVVGDPAADARATLTGLGLRVQATRRYDVAVPKGTVIEQSPAGGSTLYQDDTVDLVVSQGPPLAQVPSVFGRHRDDAVAALEGAGFVVSVEEAPGYVGFDLVSSQSPGAATMAPSGSTVTIYLH